MSAYLPKDSSGNYAEGGGLYAIGLIHANHGSKVIDYLSQSLRSNTSEVSVRARVCVCVCSCVSFDDLVADCQSRWVFRAGARCHGNRE